MGEAGIHVAIIAVGSELLSTDRLDTNSLTLAAALERHGAVLERKSVVGDAEAELATEVASLVGRHDLVVVTGGLGPTADDLTRPAVARALGRRTSFDPGVAAGIEARFRDHGLRMPEVNRRQAEVLEGAELIPNRRGTAPGMILREGRTTLFLLPGVPTEMEGMVESHLLPWLADRSGGAARETWTIKVAALPESAVEEKIAPAYEEFGREAISILAKPGEIRLRFTASGDEAERHRRLAAMEARLAGLVGPAVFARSEAETLEAVVGDLLRRSGYRVAIAESCTGGLLAARITDVPGSSDYFPGGVVTYSNELKTRLVGVPEDLLAACGAVSEEVARAMAEGVRRALGADLGVGITGVAGPGGGSAEKPVGTVHLAVAGPGEGEVEHRRVRFPGDRERVRQQSAQLALEMLRRRLLAAGAAPAAAERRPPGVAP